MLGIVFHPLRHRPFLCPRGHDLRQGGTVTVGWQPCQCPSAMGTHRGHRIYRCRACEDEGVTMICYLPYHART